MLTLTDLHAIIAARDWQRLIGEVEGEYFDCKKVCYDLASEVGKQELAKDVSSFANAEGGVVFLGVESAKDPALLNDVVATLRPFPASLFNPGQIQAILAKWIVPQIEGLSIQWLPEREGADQGFGVLTIPPQKETHKPFLIAKVVLDEGRRRDLLVGYVQRRRDVSQPATVSEIALWLSHGRNYRDRIEGRLDEILVAQRTSSTPGTGSAHIDAPDRADVDQRMAESLEVHGLISRPHYVLAAAPSSAAEVKDLFTSGPDSLAHLLEHPPVMRYGGWTLESGHQARIIEGRYREVASTRKVLRLYRDGVFIFAAAADGSFLARTDNSLQHRPLLVSLALIEVTYSFCVVYLQILSAVTPQPNAFSVQIRLGGLRPDGREPTVLNPFAVRSYAFADTDNAHPAPQDTVVKVLPFPAFVTAGAMAYEIVKEIYLWFGHEPGTVPYTTERDGSMEIDPQKISGHG